MPRLIEGNVALQVLAASTKSPRHLNIERNDDRSDDIILLALAGGWPRATWRSLLARALHKAERADAMARRSDGRFTLIRSRADLDTYVARRTDEPAITAGLLAIEGAHALDDDPANVEVVADAGFRMMSPSHFFDNAFGGSAHGVEKGGLTRAGREMIRRMEARGMVLDLAHASGPTIDDGRGDVDGGRSSSRTPASAAPATTRGTSPTSSSAGWPRTGGLIGIGFWPTACGGDDAASIARSIRYAIGVAGAEHVGARLRLRRRASRCRSTRAGWCGSPMRCWMRASTTTRSRRSWARTRSASSRTRCRRPEPDPRSRSGQTSSAMSAAARAAPSEATGR